MKKEEIKELIENIFDISNSHKQYENGCIKLFSQLHDKNGVTVDEFISAKDEMRHFQ